MKSKLSFTTSRIVMSLWVFSLCFLFGCQTQPPTVSTSDEAAIYAAVIRQIYEQDDTYGGNLHPPIVYLIQRTDDGVGDPDVEKTESKLLEESLITAISTELEDLPTELIWVQDIAEVPLGTESGKVAGEGVIITLGNIHTQRNGSVHISGSIYIASLAAGGQTYIVKQVDGMWQVVGTTGVQWIS